MPWSIDSLPDLPQQLQSLIHQIPTGRVTTYGRLAAALGDRAAARWVGMWTMQHPLASTCPCHRVLRADGQLGGYHAGVPSAKRELLAAEAVALHGDRILPDVPFFDQFESARPLVNLRRHQAQLAGRVLLDHDGPAPRLLGGVDVSYINASEGVAAYTLFDVESGRMVWSTTITRPVRFPYIPSYLAFRELPLLVELLDKVRLADRLPGVLLVDGSGILHPRRGGLACLLGVSTGLSTIGVTKHRLYGRAVRSDLLSGQWCEVQHDDTVLGAALRSSRGGRRPIYVSPGHRINVRRCVEIIQRSMVTHRLPEPLFEADRLSRTMARAAKCG